VTITMQQEQALGIARLLAKAGVPMFLARPNPESPNGYDLPFGWETNEPDTALDVVDSWQPGLALCAVTGHVFDLVDVDPRSGGTESAIEMPHSYLTAETPSGGRHHFIRTLGVGSLDGKVAPGIDVKSGTLEGTGRGFAFIAPTVRRSKVDGLMHEYRWVLGPKGPALPTPDQLSADGTGAMLRARVLEHRRSSSASSEKPRRLALSQASREFENAMRRLSADVAHWQRHGWGGAAHGGILAATMHLARLNPARALEAFTWAFREAGVEPDARDLAKLESALERAVPDIVVPDHELSAAEAFFLGAEVSAPMRSGPSLPSNVAGHSPPAAYTTAEWAPSGVVGADMVSRFGALDEFEAESIEVPDALIDGLLFSGTKARLSAPSGAGKTWVALDLAAHVATGRAWQGAEVRKTGVLYVAGEGAPTFAPRVRSWREFHGMPSGIRIEPRAVQMAQSEWFEFIEHYSTGFGLFIFDTQGSMTIGLKENDNDHANIFHARLDALIQRTGATILLVHHTGWEDVTRPRGASATFGGMDTELTLSAPKEGALREATLYQAKQKYIERGKPKRLGFEKHAGGLVIAPSTRKAEDFFDATRAAETWSLVLALEAFDGALPNHGVRHLKTVIRDELGRSGRNPDIEDAIRAFKIRAGVQGIQAPEWLMNYGQNQVSGMSDLPVPQDRNS
jgi:hypothetical protein